MNIVQQIEQEQLTDRNLDLRPGDDLRVHFRIKDGEKVRVQVYEGTLISIKGTGTRTMLVVRKISFGVGVERLFPLHSPSIEKIEIKTRHTVRRARLYYLRNLAGKAARLKDAARNS